MEDSEAELNPAKTRKALGGNNQQVLSIKVPPATRPSRKVIAQQEQRAEATENGKGSPPAETNSDQKGKSRERSEDPVPSSSAETTSDDNPAHTESSGVIG